MDVRFINAADSLDDLKEVFREYTELLINSNSDFKAYLELQHYSEEEEHPDVKYNSGKLYLVLVDGEVAGTVGFKKLDERTAELKRMYLRPKFRGYGISNIMLDKILNDAKVSGATEILLDTLSNLESAIRLYKKNGFYEIEKYNDNPVKEGMVYLRKTL